jgi:hypothetical protein
MNSKGNTESTHDEMLAVLDFYRHRKRWSWRELCEKAGVDYAPFVECVRSGEFESSNILESMHNLSGALGLDLFQLADFKFKYSLYSRNPFARQYFVEVLTREYCFRLPVPVLHRERLLGYCTNLVAGELKSSQSVAARHRPPRKVLDVSHIYQSLVQTGYFTTFTVR